MSNNSCLGTQSVRHYKARDDSGQRHTLDVTADRRARFYLIECRDVVAIYRWAWDLGWVKA